jgi:hypothetical protein
MLSGLSYSWISVMRHKNSGLTRFSQLNMSLSQEMHTMLIIDSLFTSLIVESLTI